MNANKCPHARSRLTVNRQAGGGAPGALWVGVELAGVAGLVLHPDPLYGQPGVSHGAAQAHAAAEGLLHQRVAVLGVGRHAGCVALFGRLPPQDLSHPLREVVRAGEGGLHPAHCSLVALQAHFCWDRGKTLTKSAYTIRPICVFRIRKEMKCQCVVGF